MATGNDTKKCDNCGETKVLDVPPFEEMSLQDRYDWKKAGGKIEEICPNGCKNYNQLSDEIEALQKENEQTILNYEKALKNEWKICDQKLANRDKEWIEKIEKHRQQSSVAMNLTDWERIKKKMGVKNDKNS